MDLRAKNRSYDNVARCNILELYDSEKSSGFIFQLLSMKYQVFLWQKRFWKLLWGQRRLKCKNIWGFSHPTQQLENRLWNRYKVCTCIWCLWCYGKKVVCVYLKRGYKRLFLCCFIVLNKKVRNFHKYFQKVKTLGAYNALQPFLEVISRTKKLKQEIGSVISNSLLNDFLLLCIIVSV